MTRCGLLLCLVLLAGCSISSAHSEVHSNASASVIIIGTGALSPSIGLVTIQCDPAGGARVSLSGKVQATSAGEVTISASTCGSAHQILGTVEPSADFSMPLRLGPTGAHELVLCFMQSNGDRTGSFVCSESFDLESQCDEPEEPIEEVPGGSLPVGERSCRDVGFFGDLVGNPSLCTGAGNLHIPVHARGAFGEAPQLTILGPNGFEHQAVMRHSGQSCNYHYDWDASQNGGAGEYSFTIRGAGETQSFIRHLECP